jgi:hypothetical protein
MLGLVTVAALVVRAVGANDQMINILLVGFHRGHEFLSPQAPPSQHRNDFDMKFENLLYRLHALSSTHTNAVHNFDFAVLMSRAHPHHAHHQAHTAGGKAVQTPAPHPAVTVPFQSKLIFAEKSSVQGVDAFFQWIQTTVQSRKPDVLWVFENLAVERLSSVSKPIIHMCSPLSHNLHYSALGIQSNVWHRFYSEDSAKKWGLLSDNSDRTTNFPDSLTVNQKAEKCHLLLHSFCIDEGLHEVEQLMKVSRLLVTNGSGTNALEVGASIREGNKPVSLLTTAQEQAAQLLPQLQPGDSNGSVNSSAVVDSSPRSEPSQLTGKSTVTFTPPAVPAGASQQLRPVTMVTASAYPAAPYTGDKPLVVGSMTTMLKRLEQVKGPFGQTLDSILKIDQIDYLYLNVPWQYGVRSKSENITLSKDLLNKLEATTNGKLRILRSEDYGPATKLLPTLLLPDDMLPPNTMIITFDDDRIYTKEAVSALVSTATARPDSVVAIAAWPVSILSPGGKRGRPGGPTFHSKIPRNVEGIQYQKAGPVDLSLGFYGVLYRKSFFTKPSISLELFDYDRNELFKKHCQWVDDIWFSGHLERLNVPRYVIGKVANSRADITPLSNVAALSLDQGESVKQNYDNVFCAEGLKNVFGIWK